MGGPSRYSFSKRERERKKREKKEEKLARRHGKSGEEPESGTESEPAAEDEEE